VVEGEGETGMNSCRMSPSIRLR